MEKIKIVVHLHGGGTVERFISPLSVDMQVADICQRGIREQRGDCIVIYPAAAVQRIEANVPGSKAPSGTKKPKTTTPRRPKRLRPVAVDDGGEEDNK